MPISPGPETDIVTIQSIQLNVDMTLEIAVPKSLIIPTGKNIVQNVYAKTTTNKVKDDSPGHVRWNY